MPILFMVLICIYNHDTKRVKLMHVFDPNMRKIILNHN